MMPLGKVIFGLKIFLYPVERRIKRKEGEKENIFSLWIKNWRKKKKARLLTAFRDFFRLLWPNWSFGRERQEKPVICHF